MVSQYLHFKDSRTLSELIMFAQVTGEGDRGDRRNKWYTHSHEDNPGIMKIISNSKLKAKKQNKKKWKWKVHGRNVENGT